MSHRHLNFFTPSNKPDAHEDQLTRAALVVIRIVPLARAEFLKLVDPAWSLASLPACHFDTQTKSVHPDLEKRARGGSLEPELELEVVSVFLCPDIAEKSIPVEESRRDPRYDGVLRFGDELVIVIESKLREEVDPTQAEQIVLGDLSGHCRLRPDGVLMRWHELLAAWLELDEKDLLAPAESVIVNDFFDFTEESFAYLLPFNTLSKAGDNDVRVQRRLNTLLTKATGLEPNDGDVREAWGTLQRIELKRNNPSGDLELRLWPGEQKTQATLLYGQADRARRCAALDGNAAGAARWSVKPNVNVSNYIPNVRQWTTCNLSLSDYVDLWVDDRSEVRRHKTEELDSLFEWLAAHGLASEADRSDFNEKFVIPRLDQVDLRASLEVTARWPWEQAVELDSLGRLEIEIGDAAHAALTALGEDSVRPH